MKLPDSKLKWKKGDIDAHRVLDNWTLAPPSFDEPIVPHEIFEKFFTTKEMERCSTQRQSLINDDHKKVKVIHCHPLGERL